MAERSALEAEIMTLKQKVEELDSRLQDMVRENQKLNTLASDRKKEIDQLKLKLGDGSLIDQVESLRRENEQLKKLGLVTMKQGYITLYRILTKAELDKIWREADMKMR